METPSCLVHMGAAPEDTQYSAPGTQGHCQRHRRLEILTKPGVRYMPASLRSKALGLSLTTQNPSILGKPCASVSSSVSRFKHRPQSGWGALCQSPSEDHSTRKVQSAIIYHWDRHSDSSMPPPSPPFLTPLGAVRALQAAVTNTPTTKDLEDVLSAWQTIC